MILKKPKRQLNKKEKISNKFNAIALGNKKSTFEQKAEDYLTESGLFFDYEPIKIILNQGFKFCSIVVEKENTKESCTNRDMTYTPDFVAKDWSWVIETKGMMTPDFAIKWKLFKQWLSINKPDCIAYLVKGGMKQLKLTVNHIANNRKFK
jgi:hypothetical protein